MYERDKLKMQVEFLRIFIYNNFTGFSLITSKNEIETERCVALS